MKSLLAAMLFVLGPALAGCAVTGPSGGVGAGSASDRAKLIDAIIDDRQGDVELLLAGGVNVNGQDREGRTPSMVAAAKGATVIVDRLLAKGANVNGKGKYGFLPCTRQPCSITGRSSSYC